MGFLFLAIGLLFAGVILICGKLEDSKCKGYNMPEESAPVTTSSTNCGTVTIDFKPIWHHLAIVQKKGRKCLFLDGRKLTKKEDYTIDFWSQDPAFEQFKNDLVIKNQKGKEK